MTTTGRAVTSSATTTSITVRIPMRFARRGGRKVLISPGGTVQGSVQAPPRPRIDSALVKAVARAFRWRDFLENGTYATIREIAKAEKINDSYVCRILRLTLLTPDIVEAILDGRHAAEIGLPAFLKPFPNEWEAQRVEIVARTTLPSVPEGALGRGSRPTR